jgi:hypothetical protein
MLQYDESGVALPGPPRTSIAMKRSIDIAAMASGPRRTGALDANSYDVVHSQAAPPHGTLQSEARMALSLRATAILDVRGADFRFMASGTRI